MNNRYLLLVGFHTFNSLMLVFSVALAGLACFLCQATIHKRHTAAVVYITAFATLLLSLVGCFGAIRKHRKALTIYMVVDIIFILGMIAFGVILLFAALDKYVVKAASRDIEELYHKYHLEGREQYLIDNYQAYNECCGVDGPDEWLYNDSGYVPASCCDKLHDHSCNVTMAHQVSCTSVWVKKSKYIFRLSAAMLWIDSIIGIICFISAFGIVRRLKQEEKDPKGSKKSLGKGDEA